MTASSNATPAIVGLILSIAAVPTVAQTPTGSVQGRVICKDGDVPARYADVRLVPLASLLQQGEKARGTNQEALDSRTDFRGYYVLPSVPIGVYVVEVDEDGYGNDLHLILANLDRFTDDERKKLLANFPQVVVTGGSVANENVVIHRGGAISGRVVIDTGGTLGQANVLATMVSSDLLGDARVADGEKPFSFERGAHPDDRGVYRIAGLPAGKYRIGVRLNESYFQASVLGSGAIEINPTRTGTGAITVFAPDALTGSDAKLVEVGDGDELSDIDITIPMRLLHSISGTVTLGGAPVDGANLTIIRGGKGVGDSSAISTSDGSYRFDLLPAGTYTIQVKYRDASMSSGPSITQKITVQLIDNDILDANIDLPTSATAK